MTVNKNELMAELKKQITDGFKQFGVSGTINKIEGLEDYSHGWKYNGKAFSKITKTEIIEILNKITF